MLQNGSSGSRKRQRLASADSSVVPNFISLSSKAARSVLSPSTPSRQRKSAESPSLPPAPIKDGVSFPDTPQQSPAKQQTPAALHKEDLLWSDTPQPPAAEPTSTSLEQQARRQEEKSAEADNLYEVLFTSPSSLSGSGARQPAAPGHVAVHQNGLPSPRAPVSPGPPAPPESMAGISNNDSHSNKHAGGRKYAMPYALPAGTVEVKMNNPIACKSRVMHDQEMPMMSARLLSSVTVTELQAPFQNTPPCPLLPCFIFRRLASASGCMQLS